jgi:hypothetical protein
MGLEEHEASVGPSGMILENWDDRLPIANF